MTSCVAIDSTVGRMKSAHMPATMQQLFLDEQVLGHHGTRAAGTGEPGDRRQEVEKQDDAQPLRLWRQDPLRAGGPSVMASDRRQPTVHCCARSRSVH